MIEAISKEPGICLLFFNYFIELFVDINMTKTNIYKVQLILIWDKSLWDIGISVVDFGNLLVTNIL